MTMFKAHNALRWLTRVFLRLDSARYHRLPNVSINRAFTNDASNLKKKGNHFGA